MSHLAAAALTMVLAGASGTSPASMAAESTRAPLSDCRPAALSVSDSCGCWDLYFGLTGDCDRRYQNYLDTCHGLPEGDQGHCYNGAEYWRNVCYQDAAWELEHCLRSCH